MSITTHVETAVATRFDALEARFRAVVDADDFRVRTILRALGPVDGRCILDLGCGKGRFAMRLIERGARVVGVDPSRGMLAAARASGLDVAVAAGRRLPFDDAAFDAVIAVEVLQHVGLDDRSSTLQEAARVLRPGGRIAIVDKNAASLDPNRPWLPAVLVKRIDERRGYWMYEPSGPARERWFWPGAMAGLLREAGFESIRAERLIAPEESRHRVFRAVPLARRFVSWTAERPGGFG